jgi:hypothetical protein
LCGVGGRHVSGDILCATENQQVDGHAQVVHEHVFCQDVDTLALEIIAELFRLLDVAEVQIGIEGFEELFAELRFECC